MKVLRYARVLSLMLITGTAQAGNGLNDIGYGSESAALANADLALARDASAFNTNPAGLTQIKTQIVDVLLEPYAYLGNRHTDALGNDAAPDNAYGSGFGGGYARRLAGTHVVVGAGLFFQGGAGFVYKDFITPFGTRDELSGLSGSIKIAPGLAWQVNERWSLGGVVGLLYSSSRQKFFPRTSTADFSGFRVDGLSGFSANLKVGVQYRPAPEWVLAAAYTSKAPIRLDGGTVKVNRTHSTGGYVTYHDARQSGLAFPQDFGVGARYRVSPRWSVLGEATWSDWSSALKATRLTARTPSDPAAPAFEPLESPLQWRDHVLFSIGSLYQWSPSTELRAGLSHARNPIPNQNLNPTFALIPENAITGGVAHQWNPDWVLAITAIYQPPAKEKYNSGLTGASSERWEVTGFYITFSRRW